MELHEIEIRNRTEIERFKSQLPLVWITGEMVTKRISKDCFDSFRYIPPLQRLSYPEKLRISSRIEDIFHLHSPLGFDGITLPTNYFRSVTLIPRMPDINYLI